MAIALSTIVKDMTAQAGLDDSFADSFLSDIRDNRGVLDEFIYYMKNGDFLCKHIIHGLSVVDIMVWQIDHFKAYIDRGDYEMRENPARMAMMAFDTMLKMEKCPDKYLELFANETGTDYVGHYK